MIGGENFYLSPQPKLFSIWKNVVGNQVSRVTSGQSKNVIEGENVYPLSVKTQFQAKFGQNPTKKDQSIIQPSLIFKIKSFC